MTVTSEPPLTLPTNSVPRVRLTPVTPDGPVLTLAFVTTAAPAPAARTTAAALLVVSPTTAMVSTMEGEYGPVVVGQTQVTLAGIGFDQQPNLTLTMSVNDNLTGTAAYSYLAADGTWQKVVAKVAAC
jgi:hypothetical protein